MRQVEVQVAGAVRLAGTLALPDRAGPHPGVLLVAGSGPVDRDENAPRLRLNIFRELRSVLAAAGLAVLSYDKRGTGASAGSLLSSGLSDLVSDARCALAHLAGGTEVDAGRLFVVGHSEGGLIAPLLADQPGVCGLVLLCSTHRPLQEP